MNIPSRPDLNAATTTSGRAWNTIARFDHQPAAAHTWSLRWLRESSPQERLLIPAGGRQVTLDAEREEDDVDQTTVGSLQSVLGNSRLNSLRVAFTRENEASTVRFQLTPPASVERGSYRVKAVAEMGGEEFRESVDPIEYHHIETRYLFEPAEAKVEALDNYCKQQVKC